MISIFPANVTDFSKNGECVLEPTSCQVNETLNGEWELQLTHPLDAWNKWTWLQAGNIIKAPVPSSMTPRVKLMQATEGKSIYRINTSYSPLNLWDRPSRYRSLAQYKKGLDVQVISTANPDFYEVIAPDGKRGWMASEYLLFLRTELTNAVATSQVVEPRQLRDQPFRIYRVVPELTQVTAYARHIFYDLLDNMIYQYKPANGTAGNIVAEGIIGACETDHLFNVFSDITKGMDGMDIQNANPVEALMGEGGLIDLTSSELARDWFDVFAMTRVGIDTDIQIRQGKNLLGISYDVDDSNVVTRIVPTGETKDGELLYLDPKYVDSPHIGDYSRPRWIHLPVSEAKVGDDMTVEQAKAKLLQAAQDEFEKGCDLPDISIDVDFLNLADTEEYAQYKPLTDIFLGDSVRVIVQKLGLEVALRMTEYSYDCLLRRYMKMTLGMASETIAGSMISPRQLPTGGIKGMKLSMGSVGTGQLQALSVGSLQVKAAAIGAAHIQNAAIDTAHIQDAAITNAKIGTAAIDSANIKDAAITNAKIGTAAIDTANIKDASITNAKIGLAAIDTANIKDAAITNAKIGTATIGTANIQDASIVAAHIIDGSITNAKIHDLSAEKITAGTLDAARIGAESITGNHISGGTITGSKIAGLTITGEHIAGQTITGEKIAAGTITGEKIAAGTIAGTHITAGSLTGSLIEAGTINGGLIYAGEVDADKIKAASIGAAQINAGHIAANSIETAHIKAGQVIADHILGGTITSDKLYSGEVEANKITSLYLYAGDVEAMKILAGNIGASQIQSNHIISGAITGLHIQGNVIEGRHIIGETITGDHILGETITGNHLASETIQAHHIEAGSIVADRLYTGELESRKIGAEHIKAGGITADNIAANAIVAGTPSLPTAPSPTRRSAWRPSRKATSTCWLSCQPISRTSRSPTRRSPTLPWTG